MLNWRKIVALSGANFWSIGVVYAVFQINLTAKEITASQLEFFEHKIRPVLAESCYECHNSVDKAKGDIALDLLYRLK